jgi:hypothetical protein
VRAERWKYVRYPEFAGMEEPYDLKSEPVEMRNLMRDSSAETSREEMERELERLLQGGK